jgi:NADH-quinone oxidoreductase subunit B
MGPVLKRIHEQMAEPKWSSPSASAPARAASTRTTTPCRAPIRSCPIDVYIPGCPPRPEQVLDGLMLLQDRIQKKQGHNQLASCADAEPVRGKSR